MKNVHIELVRGNEKELMLEISKEGSKTIYNIYMQLDNIGSITFYKNDKEISIDKLPKYAMIAVDDVVLFAYDGSQGEYTKIFKILSMLTTKVTEGAQKISSANTSQKQLPCTHKILESIPFNSMLDYGCGKYDLLKEKVESLGKKYFGYDPYNRSMDQNLYAMSQEVDLITCNNVLNVIECDKTMEQVVIEIAEKNPKQAIFCVYEGDGKGEGRKTKEDCFQRNQKPWEYSMLLMRHFDNVERKGNIFICA